MEALNGHVCSEISEFTSHHMFSQADDTTVNCMYFERANLKMAGRASTVDATEGHFDSCVGTSVLRLGQTCRHNRSVKNVGGEVVAQIKVLGCFTMHVRVVY